MNHIIETEGKRRALSLACRALVEKASNYAMAYLSAHDTLMREHDKGSDFGSERRKTIIRAAQLILDKAQVMHNAEMLRHLAYSECPDDFHPAAMHKAKAEAKAILECIYGERTPEMGEFYELAAFPAEAPHQEPLYMQDVQTQVEAKWLEPARI